MSALPAEPAVFCFHDTYLSLIREASVVEDLLAVMVLGVHVEASEILWLCGLMFSQFYLTQMTT